MRKFFAEILFAVLCVSALSPALQVSAQAKKLRRMEYLSRGVVAVNQGGGKVFVGWRLPRDAGKNRQVKRQAARRSDKFR
jgi:hypothetical protein